MVDIGRSACVGSVCAALLRNYGAVVKEQLGSCLVTFTAPGRRDEIAGYTHVAD